MTTMEEQETIITQNRADDHVSIWTSNTHDIAYFSKTDGFELVKEDTYEGEVVSAAFRIPNTRANLRRVLKSTRKPMSEERKAALRAQLERGRNSQ